MRIFLTGLPLAAVCLTGFTVACASPHPAGLASAVPASAVPGSAVPGSAVPASAVPGSAVLASAVPGSAVLASASAEGILTGHLYAVGGPAPGAPRPWPGTVTLTGPGGRRAISVGVGGGYSVLVPAGPYTVAGRSPLYRDGAGVCQAPGPVMVASGHRTRADVLCQLR